MQATTRTHLGSRAFDLIQERVQVPEAQFLPEVGVQLAVVLPLVFARLFGVGVRLVDQEIVGQDVERDAREVQLEEAGGFVAAVADEPLVAPTVGGCVSANSERMVNREGRRTTASLPSCRSRRAHTNACTPALDTPLQALRRSTGCNWYCRDRAPTTCGTCRSCRS